MSPNAPGDEPEARFGGSAAPLRLTNDEQREAVLRILETAADPTLEEIAAERGAGADALVAEVEKFAAEAAISQLGCGDVLHVPACSVDHLYCHLTAQVTGGAEATEGSDRIAYVECATSRCSRR